ncbi:hypothetical protein PSTH1771_04930 [Pseudomonas syringae pv. theae]|nr:hypothetical protein BV349_04993 [Pseudomonas syringae pv. actinidiae]SOS35325.1 hypothetical protein CFBP6411_03968 [Pseudomonas syringae group genomosp. 3]GKQ48150.1 hypothetical protein PSTH2693_23360 [Pseudomonas syringae pv. theae]OSN71333.1 hypothetical protein BV351_04945 [Pseudomonas syringae pv. actinidiae]RMQ34284.1 hypothetical protein ALQ07_00418 [Pseudomonas syringae pv. actinidiae]
MFRCFAGPSGTSSTNNYRSLSDAHDSRLEALPAGRRNGQVIQVSTTTFDRMVLAHKILLRTAHETFPDGPGNQEANVWMSGGRSWMRKEMCRTRVDEHASQDQQIKGIKETGGGNCGEYATTVFAELQRTQRNTPVLKVLESYAHSLVIVGDWRDHNTGDHAIVVDPWQGLKKVHTYGERSVTATPLVTATALEGAPERSGKLKAAFALKPAAREEVDAVIRAKTGSSSSGPWFARSVIRENKAVMFDQVAGTQNLHTVYRDPSGRESAFNSLPSSYLESYLDARDAIVKNYA